MTDAQMPEGGAQARADGPMLAADGTPLKRSLARSLRRRKLQALMLIAPLLLFVFLTFVAPIFDMLYRSVENSIVESTMPRSIPLLQEWDSSKGDLPDEAVFEAAFHDLFLAKERKEHTKLGTRLNYERTGLSSMFRRSGGGMDDIAEAYSDPLKDLDKDWDKAEPWLELMGDADWVTAAQEAQAEDAPDFVASDAIAALLPATIEAYGAFQDFLKEEDPRKRLAREEPWGLVHMALFEDLADADVSGYAGPGAERLKQAAELVKSGSVEAPSFSQGFIDAHDGWADIEVWRTIQTYSPRVTTGYFLNAVDMQLTPDGVEMRPEKERVYGLLFGRTIYMSLAITISCILLAYPVAYLLSNLPLRQANLLMILVLLPFWTSLLVRTSAWKVMLQQQGVINEVLVWMGIVADGNRLALINNQLGTIIAMTHILLPFMILPMFSVMSTIPPSYVRAAKSLGASNWTAFWRVYFPQSVPGIGAGSILVFILAIGYYITPAIVGGNTGTFISNRISYHISSSLNWGLGAALGAILLAAVLILYWAYDRIVGIDNVKLGG